MCEKHRGELDSLRREKRRLLRKIARLESERDGDDDDSSDDLVPSYSKPMHERSSPTGMPADADRARRRYRRETMPDRVSQGMAVGRGRVYGEDIARMAMKGTYEGDSPLDRAMQTISRYRRHSHS